MDPASAERALALVPDGRPAVAAPQKPAVRERIERAASDRGIPLLLGDRDFRAVPSAAGVDIEVRGERYVAVALPDRIGVDELATGIAAALALGALGIRMREDWVIAGCRRIAGG